MILFLDFDGVMHPDFAREKALFSATPLLWQVLEACPLVDVVFSTSWREIHPMSELIDFATQGGGEHLAGRFIGSTPSIVTERGPTSRNPIGGKLKSSSGWPGTASRAAPGWH